MRAASRALQRLQVGTSNPAQGALAALDRAEEALAPRARPGFHIEDEDLDGLRTVGEAVDYAVARI